MVIQVKEHEMTMLAYARILSRGAWTFLLLISMTLDFSCMFLNAKSEILKSIHCLIGSQSSSRNEGVTYLPRSRLWTLALKNF